MCVTVLAPEKKEAPGAYPPAPALLTVQSRSMQHAADSAAKGVANPAQELHCLRLCSRLAGARGGACESRPACSDAPSSHAGG